MRREQRVWRGAGTRRPGWRMKWLGVKGEGRLLDFKGASLAAIGGDGRPVELCSVSLLAGDDRATLGAHFWHFRFGIEP